MKLDSAEFQEDVVSFTAGLSAVSAFTTAGGRLADLILRDPQSREVIAKTANAIGVAPIEGFAVITLQDARDGNVVPESLRPLVGALYKRSTDFLVAGNIPSVTEMAARLSDTARQERLLARLANGLLSEIGASSREIVTRHTTADTAIRTAIAELESVASSQSAHAERAIGALTPDGQTQAAICILNGVRVPCVLFWIVVIAVMLVALILEPFD